MKVANKEISINKFVGLKSKFHSMLSDGGKECNTAKGVNIPIEFKKFRDTLLNKKMVRHKVKIIQSKTWNLEHTNQQNIIFCF